MKERERDRLKKRDREIDKQRERQTERESRVALLVFNIIACFPIRF